MSDRVLDVLVVGAGPVGLTLAHELRRRGLSIALIDALPEPTRQSRATDLQPRTLEMLDAIGLIDDFLAVGRRVRGVRFYSAHDEVFFLDFEHLESPYPFLLSLPQPATEALLARRLGALGVEAERPEALVALDDRGDHVQAEVEGPRGRRSLRARWLVGCDGAKSTVRQLVGASFDGRSFEEAFVIADVEVDQGLADDELGMYMHPAGFLTVLALPGQGVFRLFFDDAPGREREPDLAELQAMVDERSPRPFRLRAVSWTSVFRIHQRLTTRLRHGRVFLAGNAAHIHSPAGGQGMNTGIQDACNLAWKLALVCRGLASDALLGTYHDERHKIARAILLETDVATRSSMLKNPVARALRDAGARLAAAIDAVGDRIEARCAELDLGYDQGPAVGERTAPLLTAPVFDDRSTEAASLRDRIRFDEGPAAGARAPDVGGLRWLAPGSPPREVALRELRRHTGFTLLLFDGEATTEAGYANLLRAEATARRWLREHVRSLTVIRGSTPPAAWSGGEILLDPQGALHRRYGARSECLYLLRPDGHVGFRCQPADPDALVTFLRQSFVAPEIPDLHR